MNSKLLLVLVMLIFAFLVSASHAEPPRVVPLSAPNCSSTTEIAYGPSPVSGEIGASSETDCFTFSGAAGDKVIITVNVTSGDPSLLVELHHAGVEDYLCGQFSGILRCELDTTAPYVIRLAYPGDQTGTYWVQVQRQNNPVGCSVLNFGELISASIGEVGEQDCYTTPAEVGDVLRLRAMGINGEPVYSGEIFRPDGSSLCYIPGECTIDAAGSYGIIFSWDSMPMDYRVHLQRLNNPTGCTALSFGGNPTSHTIEEALEEDCFTYSASAGDWIQVRALKTSGDLYTEIELLGVDGKDLLNCADVAPGVEFNCQTPVGGQHTVMIKDWWSHYTGGYNLYIQRMNNPIGCTPITLGTPITGRTIDTVNQVDCYTFPATAGQSVRVMTYDANWRRAGRHRDVSSGWHLRRTVFFRRSAGSALHPRRIRYAHHYAHTREQWRTHRIQPLCGRRMVSRRTHKHPDQ
ncbi:MAG: hypothetical protein IPK19_40785 [Chloroflexi bacterium]|nr:hypothetical protein [Chloroflexota bacterium]